MGMTSSFRSPAGPASRLSRPLAVGLIFALALVLQACAPRTINLTHVLVGERAALPAELSVVQVFREGQLQSTQAGMTLQPGDEIRTDSTTTVVIRFPSKAEAILKPGTHVQLASLELIFGQVLIILDNVKGFFEVKTKDVTAGASSTEYFVGRDGNGRVLVTVLEGRVELKSPMARWAPVALTPGQQAAVPSGEAPRVRTLSQQEINALLSEANRLERLIRPTESKILVPDVRGVRKNEAVSLLHREGLEVGNIEGRITRTRPVGTVVDQSPRSGTRLLLGGVVGIAVEAEPAVVPRLTGETFTRAERALRRSGLRLGTVNRRITGTAAAETVTGQSVRPGSTVPKGSAVNLVVEAESVVVPDVERLHIDEARARIGNTRLRVGRVDTRITGRFRSGTVLSQRPPAGERVPPGTRVGLVTEARSVVVPPLRGLSLNQARNKLNQLRLGLGRTSDQLTEGMRDGTVLSQTPSPGARVELGRRVDLVLAVEGRRVPNLIGRTVGTADSALSRRGLRRGGIRKVQTRQYETNTIIGQRPQANTLVRAGTPVDIDVAQQPAPVIRQQPPPVIRERPAPVIE